MFSWQPKAASKRTFGSITNEQVNTQKPAGYFYILPLPLSVVIVVAKLTQYHFALQVFISKSKPENFKAF